MNKLKLLWARWKYLIIAVVFVSVAWALNMFVPCFGGGCKIITDTNSLGSIGDRFGIVNALFSGLSLAGIIWAIRQQEEQLAMARNELKATREMLDLAREDANKTKEILDTQNAQLKRQNEDAARQRFEQSFMGQLEVLIKIEGVMHTSVSGSQLLGRSAFEYRFGRLSSFIERGNPQEMDRQYLSAVIKPMCEDMFDLVVAIGETVDAESEAFGQWRASLLGCLTRKHIITMVLLEKPDYRAFCRKFSAFEYKNVSDMEMRFLLRYAPTCDFLSATHIEAIRPQMAPNP